MSDINPNRMIPLHIADQAVAACEKENARLKAEVERLTLERNGFQQAMKANQSILETKRDVIERLRKAGDALAKTIGENGVHDNGSFHDVADSIDRWHAAKEGKPSV